MLTRFVASTGSPRDPVVEDPSRIEDVRCVVRLRGTRGTRELVIATELGGGIRVFDQCDQLPLRARTQLAFHEVASGRVLEIDADELHVFDLQTLEMLPDAPGPNDALYLYGAMRGPYPSSLAVPVAAVDGQLTVTRADLVSGLLDGVDNAFAYAPDAHGSRCVHALLPGERAEVIDGGRGIVLAFPLVPGWLLDCPVPNDLVAAQLLHDVLSALRLDLGLDASPLPVPNRAALERKLVAAGWRIEGDEAVRAKGRGIIGSLLQGAERRKLPRQGTLDELVTEARALLVKLSGIPMPETTALRRRSSRAVAPCTPVASPTAPPPTVVDVAPAGAPRPRLVADRTDWMKDFVDGHRSPSRPPPRVSAPARVVSSDITPSWMDDFDESGDADTPEQPGDEQSKRDWSNDFD